MSSCFSNPVHSHVLVPALPMETGDDSSASCSRDTKKRRVRSPHTANKLSRIISNNLPDSDVTSVSISHFKVNAIGELFYQMLHLCHKYRLHKV